MALNYNGTSPTAIKYNGTDLTVLKYGDTAVWGKPYSLSISAGANTTVTVTRTSSPNQHASTGVLSSGSVVYYGDVLTISYSVSSGYKISTSTVNGTTFTSGQSFTVTSAISVVTTAIASASWHTVWTGSRTSSDIGQRNNFTITGFNSAIKTNVSLANTRITGSLYIWDWYGYDYTVNVTLNNNAFVENWHTGNYYTTLANAQSSGANYLYLQSIPNNNSLYFIMRDDTDVSESMFDTFTVTKIEQYY